MKIMVIENREFQIQDGEKPFDLLTEALKGAFREIDEIKKVNKALNDKINFLSKSIYKTK